MENLTKNMNKNHWEKPRSIGETPQEHEAELRTIQK